MPASLDLRFDRFYSYQELTRALEQLAAFAPDRVRRHSIGRSPEGRELWMLTVTDFTRGDPDRKPAYLIHGNLHAQELSGTTAALYVAHHLVTDDTPELQRLLGEVVFYIVPRINPDGAEYALTTGGAIRSRLVPVPARNAIRPADVNGDGLILRMRIRCEDGDQRPDRQDPRLMVPREPHDDEGPFYRVFTEGFIEDWDGGEPREASYHKDFNRNWGANWRPEHQQYGAGDFPFSEPEMRAVAEFVAAHPNIFGALGFHTGCNGVLRPPASRPDEELNDRDLAVLRELGRKGEQATGFKLRAVTQYRLDESRPNRLQGHFTDWAYEHLGIYPFEIELGMLYQSAGITTDQYFASKSDEERREFDRAILRWHDAHPEAGAFVDWQPFEHPQLGRVEIGGLRMNAFANPDPRELPGIAEGCTRFILEHAGRYPHLRIVGVRVDAVGSDIFRIRATVMNTGGFPTYIAETGRDVRANRSPMARLELGDGMEMLSREAGVELGHLGARSGKRDLEWFVKGRGTARLVASAVKAGTAAVEIPIGG